MTAQRTLIPALVLAAGLACTASAQAQPYGNAWGYSRGDARVAFDNGYRSGFDRGRDDARHQRYDYGRHDEYRSANWGYERNYGNRDEYRDTFRRGFVSGYDDGYYGRNTRNSSYGDDRYRNDDRYRPLPAPPPVYGNVYPGSPAYGGGYGGGYGGSYGVNPGFDRGYREGLDKGRNDGKHHDSYDPRRQKWYRDGDRGYRDEYGPRRNYENAYRDGFLRGYDQGYRERSQW